MGLVTVFLLVLVVALLMGNGLLYMVESRRKTWDEKEPEHVMTNIQPQTTNVSLAPLEKKIELAHRRIQALEKIVSESRQINDNLKLQKKVDRLDNFRSTVEAEIIGIKEILAELQNNNITVKARAFTNTERNGERLPPKKLHELVYRAQNK